MAANGTVNPVCHGLGSRRWYETSEKRPLTGLDCRTWAKMKDPHVVALNYKVRHGPDFDYSSAKSLYALTGDVDLRLEAGKARFVMRGHHRTEKEARDAIDDYIKAWELDAALEYGPNAFRLEFDWAEIEDRNPAPGVTTLRLKPLRVAVALGTPRIVAKPSTYPAPPSRGLARSPDVESMYLRYAGYFEGSEPLASMAYFCLTVLEASTGKCRGRRKAAATKYGIDEHVLQNLGRLCSAKGGAGARKAEGLGHELSSHERHFLHMAVRAIIRRAAEVAHDPRAPLTPITLRDLPTV